jgi:hypothetical protein
MESVFVYYAHAMCMYGTEVEADEIAAITKHLPFYDIVDPSALQTKADKSDDGMRYFFRVIDYCDALVFSRLLGNITSGVGLEVNHALTRHLTVYELVNGKIVKTTTPVKFLSREETLKKYALWRTTVGLDKPGDFNTRKERTNEVYSS